MGKGGRHSQEVGRRWYLLYLGEGCKGGGGTSCHPHPYWMGKGGRHSQEESEVGRLATSGGREEVVGRFS